MYDETFGTDWESIDGREEVVERAYALGVAVRLGGTYPDELDRLTGQVETTYDQSFVDLAYQKGRDEAAGLASEAPERIWEELVEGQTIIEADKSDETEDTLPDAIRGVDIDNPPADSTESLRRPGFLERHRAEQARSDDGEVSLFGDGRSIFGRSMDTIRRKRSDGDDGSSGDGGGDEDGDADATDADEAQSAQSAANTRESEERGTGGNRDTETQSSERSRSTADGTDRAGDSTN